MAPRTDRRLPSTFSTLASPRSSRSSSHRTAASRRLSTHTGGTIRRFDPARAGAREQPVLNTLPGGCRDSALTDDGHVFLLVDGTEPIHKLNIETRTLERVPLGMLPQGFTPHRLVLGPDGEILVLARG